MIGKSEMGSSRDDVNMEGWLYLIRSNRFGLQYMRKRYFVLEDNALNCFRSIPTSKNQDPTRSALIDSRIRVTDNGRESINKDVFFTFTLYSTLNHSDRLKLGAKSSEEAARWTQYLMGVAMKEISDGHQNMVACSKKRWQPFRLSRIRERSNTHSIDWTAFSSIHMDPMSSDVIAPSSWTIFGCKNGLRLFKEADDNDLCRKYWDDHPAVMAVGVVDACSEAIFEAVMCLGPSRSEWDFCFSQGSVIETLDGHTDIIHKKFTDDWLPWGMKRRDLLLQRYWRREDDGTYVILYHSVFHEKCKPHKGFIRAYLKSGGYVISPVNHGRQSAVKHMLAIDWNFWKVYVFTSSAKYVTINMLGRIAALRELFKAKLGNPSGCDLSSSGDLSLMREIESCKTVDEEIEEDIMHDEEERRCIGNDILKTTGGSFVQLNDASDEFFDVPEQSDHDDSAQYMSVDSQQDEEHSKLSPHELADQKEDSENLNEESASREQCNYGETLPEDPTFNMAGSWAAADPSSFLIRGETYLQNHNKIKASSTLMKMVAADWLKSDKREDNLSGRPSGIVQKYAAEGRNEFFFVINIQVPGATAYNLALYYILDTPLEKVPLLESFVRGDDVFRNSRFKLIPYISKGSWIVKQSVGKKACLVGQALEINYFHGTNYLELDVDIGSSTVARGVVSLVLGYLNNLVIEMAFMIQANNLEELPEFLLGTCRLNHLDASKAVAI